MKSEENEYESLVRLILPRNNIEMLAPEILME